MPSQEEYEAVLAEELEVLESIYIDELEKVSPEQLRIRIEPEEDVLPLLFSIGLELGQAPKESLEEGSPSPIQLSLLIKYTKDYPDAPPDMSIHVVRDTKGVLGPPLGNEDDNEEDTAASVQQSTGLASVQELQRELNEVAQESLGLAMVFTLASHLRESLTTFIQRRVSELEAEASARREAEIEAEAEKFRGTAVTADRFSAWRQTFEAEQTERERKEEDAKMQKMSAKEREEYKKMKAKPSGKQLFEKGGTLEEDESRYDDDEGAVEVDWSLYTREQREKERREAEEREELERRADTLTLDDGEDDV